MINNVVLAGRLTKDPELKTAGGQSMVTFTLAVNRSFKTKDGNTEADFIRCIAWRKTAETIANMVKKGTQIGITGRIQTGSYVNNDGKRVFTTDVVADNFTFLEPKKTNDSNYTSNGQNSNSQENYTNNIGFGDISDDDLPF